MFGMAMMAVLMGVGFTSCSKEDPDGGDFSNEKKLVKMAQSGSSSVSITFTYDEKGRMIEATEVSDYSNNESFLWGDNAIKCDGVTFTLENGLVQCEDSEWKKFVYSYNQSNRLTKCEYEHHDAEVSYLWDGDKLVSVTEIENPNSDYETTTDITVTYEKSCKKGFNPYLTGMLGIGSSYYLYLGHPELLGLRTKQLPKTVSRNRTSAYNTSSEITSFSYEFDKDGYISKMIIEETYDGESSSATITLTWE